MSFLYNWVPRYDEQNGSINKSCTLFKSSFSYFKFIFLKDTKHIILSVWLESGGVLVTTSNYLNKSFFI